MNVSDKSSLDRIICRLDNFVSILNRNMCMLYQFIYKETDQSCFISIKSSEKMRSCNRLCFRLSQTIFHTFPKFQFSPILLQRFRHYELYTVFKSRPTTRQNRNIRLHTSVSFMTCGRSCLEYSQYLDLHTRIGVNWNFWNECKPSNLVLVVKWP